MMGRNKILMILSSDGQGSGEGGLRQGRFRTMLSQVGLGRKRTSSLKLQEFQVMAGIWCLQVAKNMELNNSIDCERLEIAGPGLCADVQGSHEKGDSGELCYPSWLHVVVPE